MHSSLQLLTWLLTFYFPLFFCRYVECYIDMSGYSLCRHKCRQTLCRPQHYSLRYLFYYPHNTKLMTIELLVTNSQEYLYKKLFCVWAPSQDDSDVNANLTGWPTAGFSLKPNPAELSSLHCTGAGTRGKRCVGVHIQRLRDYIHVIANLRSYGTENRDP